MRRVPDARAHTRTHTWPRGADTSLPRGHETTGMHAWLAAASPRPGLRSPSPGRHNVPPHAARRRKLKGNRLTALPDGVLDGLSRLLML